MTLEEANKLKEDIKSISDNPLFNMVGRDTLLEIVLEKIDMLVESEEEQPSFEKWLSSFNSESAPQCFNAVQELKKRLEVNMKDIKRELSKEEYEKGKINPYYLISDNIKMGYGAYGAEVHEEDGKYYLTFSMGDSCD